MSVKRETTRARRRLEFMLRCIVRMLSRPGVPEKDLNRAINTMLNEVGPAKDRPDVVAELLRRGERVPADGYPSQSMADSDIHGGFAQTGDTSTERAATRWASESAEDAARNRRPVQPDNPDRVVDRDVAADALRELVLNIGTAATFVGDFDHARKFLLSIPGRQKGRDGGLDQCTLCGATVTNVGADRLKSLYCPACYEAWGRAGRPRDHTERRQFERDRLAKLEERADTTPQHAACAHACCAEMDLSSDHKHFHEPDTCPACAEVRKAS